MRNHPRITGFLLQALTHEYTAVQQYLTQSSLCSLWGLAEWAGSFRNEAREELDHAGMLAQHLLLLGVAPGAGQMRPPRPGRDLLEMLEQDRDIEAAAVDLYAEALAFAHRIREERVAHLFARLLQDEQEHLQHLDGMIVRLESGGYSNV